MNRRTLLKRIGAAVGLAAAPGLLIRAAGDKPPVIPTGSTVTFTWDDYSAPEGWSITRDGCHFTPVPSRDPTP